LVELITAVARLQRINMRETTVVRLMKCVLVAVGTCLSCGGCGEVVGSRGGTGAILPAKAGKSNGGVVLDKLSAKQALARMAEQSNVPEVRAWRNVLRDGVSTGPWRIDLDEQVFSVTMYPRGVDPQYSDHTEYTGVFVRDGDGAWQARITNTRTFDPREATTRVVHEGPPPMHEDVRRALVEMIEPSNDEIWKTSLPDLKTATVEDLGKGRIRIGAWYADLETWTFAMSANFSAFRARYEGVIERSPDGAWRTRVTSRTRSGQ
jgi:hypothetical protein